MSAPSLADIELAFYERFFFSRDLEPYPVQEQAFEHIFRDHSVLVTVPTGTGKTMMAKGAIYKAVEQGQRVIYTTPLRALTEEKYRELGEDFGADNVGFATGDFQENLDAPIQVMVAEILWNRIYSDRGVPPADVVVMDEAHYVNDYSRGYVWEQSIIGLHADTQLILLSATIGRAHEFCHWVEVTRQSPMKLVESTVRQVPIEHQFREAYLIDVVKELTAAGDVPAIIFSFGRDLCFERARLLKSCPRFTTDEEKAEILRRADEVFHDTGASKELRGLLGHGIGVHHAGILPRYKQLVEELTLERLLRFVVSTETISAGINLPAKVVIFPSLRKFIKRKARLLDAAEYQQMAGRAGRPQFDDKGVSVTLAPEEVVQEVRKEIKDAKKKGYHVDEAKVRKSAYARARSDAQRKESVTWDEEAHKALANGEPAALSSRTHITAEMVLAIGLPDLTQEALPGEEVDLAAAEKIPAYERLNIKTVVDHLLLPERGRRDAHKALAQVTDNLRAMDIVDEHGQQIAGEMIGELPGVDALFVYYLMRERDLDYERLRELVEFLVDHDTIHRALMKKVFEARKEWIKNWLREARRDNPQASWEDAEAQYDEKHPPEFTEIELAHQSFAALLPHPELHGGKKQKKIWAQMEDEGLTFFEFVSKHDLAREEGSLFSYFTRVVRVAKSLHDVTGLEELGTMAERVQAMLAVVDARLAKTLTGQVRKRLPTT